MVFIVFTFSFIGFFIVGAIGTFIGVVLGLIIPIQTVPKYTATVHYSNGRTVTAKGNHVEIQELSNWNSVKTPAEKPKSSRQEPTLQIAE